MAQRDSVCQTSDEIHDHLCSFCEEHKRKAEASFCCNSCTKLMCISCKHLHSQLFKNHNVLDKGKVDEWVLQEDVSTDMCEIHRDKRLDMFCEDHDTVCCYVCVSTIHRSCKRVQHIPDVAKGIYQKQEFLDMFKTVSHLQEELNKLRQQKQSNRKQIKKESTVILNAVNSMRQRINKILDVLEQNTKQVVFSLLNDLEKKLQHDIEVCQSMHDELKHIVENIHKQGNSNESTAFCGFNNYKKKRNDTEQFLKSTQYENSTLIFTSNPDIERFLSSLDFLGVIKDNSGDHIYKAENVKMFNMKRKEYSDQCCISGVCSLQDGNFVIVDYSNRKVKLLDVEYNVIDQCRTSNWPRDVCHIADGEVAVTVCELFSRREIQFINTVNGKLRNTRHVKLDHQCMGITHFGGQLYIGGDDGLFIYTVAGFRVKKLFTGLVQFVDVSDEGKRIYVTDWRGCNLITLDHTGNVLSTLKEPDLKFTGGVTVSSTGTVFLCGWKSNIILQVDRDGKRKLSALATSSDGLDKPRSLWFNSKTNELFVGQDKSQMLVMKLKTSYS